MLEELRRNLGMPPERDAGVDHDYGYRSTRSVRDLDARETGHSLHLSKVNFLVPRMYLVKLHGTHFNYVLACISDMFMYSNTGFARYHILP